MEESRKRDLYLSDDRYRKMCRKRNIYIHTCTFYAACESIHANAREEFLANRVDDDSNCRVKEMSKIGSNRTE